MHWEEVGSCFAEAGSFAGGAEVGILYELAEYQDAAVQGGAFRRSDVEVHIGDCVVRKGGCGPVRRTPNTGV